MTTPTDGGNTPAAPSIDPAANPAATPPVTPAVPDPAAAPAAEPKPAATPNIDPPKPAEPAAVEPVTFDATGDAGLDLALEFIGKLGINDEHPAIKAAQEGNFGLIEALLASNPNATGYEKYVALAKDAYGRMAQAATEKAEATTKSVHEAVGGEEAWAAIKEWAAAEATPEEREQVNAAFKQGGLVATAMAKYLADAYSGATGTTITPADPANPNSARTSNVAATPLSDVEYVGELNKLRNKYGSDFETYPETQALNARYLASRKR